MLPQVDWNSPREMGRNPPFFPVGTQWETRGKNAWLSLGKKGFPQKKVLSLVLCVAMLLSVMVMGTGAASFTDQDEFSDNYAEAAEVLTGMGIIQGYDDGSFLPQRNINRAQVATMIYRAATGDVTDSKISQLPACRKHRAWRGCQDDQRYAERRQRLRPGDHRVFL